MARTIRVDDEVYAWLQGKARPLEDTPNSVLRRVAGLDSDDSPGPRVERQSHERSLQYADPKKGAAMSNPKYDELDRAKTVKEVENSFGIRLENIGRRRKFFRDENGAYYWILGGYEDWHGFPEAMIPDIASIHDDAKLIIAKKTHTKIAIYWTPLGPFLKGVENLPLTKEDDRQFNLLWQDGQPHIKELPEVILKYLQEIEYAQESKEKDQQIKEVRRIISALSNEERDALMARIAQK